MPLTDTAIRAFKPAEKPRKIADGEGLYIQVSPAGGKHWRLAYRHNGKQKVLALGSYPIVGLKDARRKRDEAKALLGEGVDPSVQKKADKRRAKIAAACTFQSVAEDWFSLRKDGWSPGYSERLWRRIEADLFPAIGGRPIAEIEPAELLDAVRKIEQRGAVVLAKRITQVAGQIFRHAVVTGRAKSDPTRDLRGALKSPREKKSRTALKSTELPDFLKALADYPTRQTELALRLIIHTAVRTGEARFGLWSEVENIDGEAPLWRIPAARMKARAEHIVPLTPSVVAILKELKELAGDSQYLLPAATKDGVISQNTLIYSLYRLGYHSRATVHGFRGTFSTILNEHGFNRDWIERQLAHAERNEVRGAYNSAEWLSDRRAMLEWWSNYLIEAERNQ